MESISEAFNKCFVSDFICSISRTIRDKAANTGRLFIAKNRAGKDGLVFPIRIDTATSRVEMLDESALTLQEAVQSDDNEMKNLLKKKWKEVREIN